MSTRQQGSSLSYRGDAAFSPTGRRLTRDESWSRRREPGEKWPVFNAQVPPELAAALDAAQVRSMGLDASSATRSGMVQAALRLYLLAADPPPAFGETVEVEEADHG